MCEETVITAVNKKSVEEKLLNLFSFIKQKWTLFLRELAG